MSTERLTSQKTIILKYLQSVKTHPTADEIYINVQEILPRISKGTVYRNLESFLDKGLICEIPGNKKRFDADISEHQHFICSQCKKVYDIMSKLTLKEENLKEVEKKGIVKNQCLYFYGICKKCLK